jgi:TIR domain
LWYAEFSLTVGDSLHKSIDHGLANSEFGVVILSRHFFEKHWPTQELNGLATREVNGKKVLLPSLAQGEFRGSPTILSDTGRPACRHN